MKKHFKKTLSLLLVATSFNFLPMIGKMCSGALIYAENNTEQNESENESMPDSIKYLGIKSRIFYDDYRHCMGLNNLYVYKGYLVIDITGKWMSSKGYLGNLHKAATALKK